MPPFRGDRRRSAGLRMLQCRYGKDVCTPKERRYDTVEREILNGAARCGARFDALVRRFRRVVTSVMRLRRDGGNGVVGFLHSLESCAVESIGPVVCIVHRCG
jgi:hypothetical protein